MRVAVYSTSDVSTTVPESAKPPLEDPIQDVEIQDVEYINMANGWILTVLGWLIWLFIAGLNVYLIVMLALGKSG
jgi:Mn2+/Fe2+ NRAMP family transporter